MKITFKKAKWIYENSSPCIDEYTEYICDFNASEKKEYTLLISADSNYTVYINGEIATFGQYPDYPEYKVGDRVDITKYVRVGHNEVLIKVWYYGKSNMSYSVGPAGLIFEILEDENVIAYSSEKTQSRIDNNYVSHKGIDITEQLGLTYEYCANGTNNEYSDSVLVNDTSYDITLRPIKKTILKERTNFKKVFGGTYTFKERTQNLSLDMQKAYLSFIRADREDDVNKPFEITSDNDDNVYFIIDLLEEECGFLDFDLLVKHNCDIYIAFGEHLVDGRVRTHKRNFTCIYHAKEGENKFLNTFRRFGLRYLEVFVESPYVKVDYIGVRKVEYPLNIKEPNTGSVLRDTIYKVSEKTLSLCMHEHYEDCPWREQGLYTMDSRNQMLFGYYAFSEFEFPRAALYLMSKGLRKKDNLLSICFPSDNKLTIPSFSLMYFVEMNEYITYSKDLSLANECYPVLQKLMQSFIDKIDETGLCVNFYNDEHDYWGFFEWSETLTGIFGETEKKYECALNAYLSIALHNMASISLALKKFDDFSYYHNLLMKINNAIRMNFWNRKDKLFASFLDKDKEKYSVLVNAMCVLCGAYEKLDTSVVKQILVENGSPNDSLYVIPITLSMYVFRYDALLSLEKRFEEFVLDDIDKTYLYMLRQGATSFWETIKGERDFDWVGSLCHGWSALPIYYYETLLNKGEKGNENNR